MKISEDNAICRRDTLHIVQDLRDLTGESYFNGEPELPILQAHSSPPPDYAPRLNDADCEHHDPYPHEIMSTAANLPDVSSIPFLVAIGAEDQCRAWRFQKLWEGIMSHFFPVAEGFTVQCSWLENSIVVFHSRQRTPFSLNTTQNTSYPIATVHIFSPLDFENAHLRNTAAQETLARRTPNPEGSAMLLISAMGKAFRAWQKDARLSDEEVCQLGLGPVHHCYDGMDDTDWMEDATAEVSRDVLRVMCEYVKGQC